MNGPVLWAIDHRHLTLDIHSPGQYAFCRASWIFPLDTDASPVCMPNITHQRQQKPAFHRSCRAYLKAGDNLLNDIVLIMQPLNSLQGMNSSLLES